MGGGYDRQEGLRPAGWQDPTLSVPSCHRYLHHGHHRHHCRTIWVRTVCPRSQSPPRGRAQTPRSPTQLTAPHDPFNSVENFLKSCVHFSTFVKGRMLIKYYFCFDH